MFSRGACRAAKQTTRSCATHKSEIHVLPTDHRPLTTDYPQFHHANPQIDNCKRRNPRVPRPVFEKYFPDLEFFSRFGTTLYTSGLGTGQKLRDSALAESLSSPA